MPLSWEKMRSTRISRLVNDHLHNSQKRRGDSSLVVETGFPTSLVDLFIKNREKLKTPSKKKRVKNSSLPTSNDSNDSVVSGSLPTSCPSLHCTSPLPLHLQSRDLDEIAIVDGGDESGSGVNRGVDTVRVCLVVVKIFMAVALAMGTDKLPTGITISAFFLFLLEYVGKCGLLKPCFEAQERLRLMVQRFWRIFADRKNANVLSYDVLLDKSFKPSCSGLNKDCGSNSPIREPQNVKPKRLWIAIAEEIQCEKEMTEDSSNDGRLGCIELEMKKLIMEKEESISERLELKERKSRRAKMKSKIKKFVTKKLQRRKERSSESYEFSPIREDKIVICEEQNTYECEDKMESDVASKSPSLSSERDGRKDFFDDKFASETLAGEEAKTEAGHDSSYLVLCLIVLIGLIGGRIFALMLALLWCLLLRSGKMLQKLIKLPMIRSFSDQPS
ncbi:uncharacterized protein LOC111412352 [Olea europaea var. sylvestris]|uniref:Uncharacterized protein n=1 Tax=Olea europaea subsp. europaea TaxID=158383 RepID=A0A8S0VJ65_OLEEU|nr:uncharacterized protein LOC111412352 [Olea europaea var. sylvestris]CAA3033794.1 Hypothetical predicted protein [Olea europaea subsp. europaea]